ncbi:hypothetical protein AC579_5236 [Pseudocercospora musae]|uniref:FAD-binding domain-containing protein n=1 Tax=Pseudocercospora musae TaxID=113226 RepID=A0A139IPK4_9PEZI|nr:hypothetical protein AC579_5236 [Pseudocercospora musae]
MVLVDMVLKRSLVVTAGSRGYNRDESAAAHLPGDDHAGDGEASKCPRLENICTPLRNDHSPTLARLSAHTASHSMECKPLTIAIIGGGTIGLILAAGLVRQKGIRVQLYERASTFRNTGAGIAFTRCAIECMERLNPVIAQTLRESGSVTSSSTKNDSKVYLRWVDGFNQYENSDPYHQHLLYELDAGNNGFEGCRRDHFLEELLKKLPQDVVQFGKNLVAIKQSTGEDKVVMSFEDGSVAEADAAIGCDGINSTVRAAMLGTQHPASRPRFSAKVAWRALIPMDDAVKALGEFKAKNTHSHVGPGANIITYPIARDSMINVTIFTSQEKWLDEGRMVVGSGRDELAANFLGWHPCVQALVRLFPTTIEKWGLFDMFDYPSPRYDRGLVCIAGDAAHASSPHHGVGSVMGVEDALCLSVLVQAAVGSISAGAARAPRALTTAWQVYNSMRYTRTQWLVNSSRRVVSLYHSADWGDTERHTKAQLCFEEIKDRSFKIWHYDSSAMVRETIQAYATRLMPSRL